MTLLVANLLFLAWAKWIDSPREAGAQDALSHLPRLQLVGETPGAKPAADNLPAASSAPAAPEFAAASMAEPASAPAPAPASVATSASRRTPAGAEKVALHVPEAVQNIPGAPQACTSVGPFNDIAHAARAAGLLTQRGFHLQQRAEEGETIEGYWVYVGGLQTDDEVGKVVERLDKGGFTDAHVMKNFSTNRRISVGMFSTRERAEKRAAAVKAMGLEPEVGERKFPGTVYWVDVALTSAAQKPPPEYLFADIGHAKVEMQPCPAGLRPGEQAKSDDPGAVERGMPRTTVASAKTQH
jgi:hypothetical protein